MGNCQAELREDRHGIEYWAYPFLGVAAEGRLVFRLPAGIEVTKEAARITARYCKMLQKANEALLRFARRIAEWMCSRVALEFLAPALGRGERYDLSRGQITAAMKEILGEERFAMAIDG
jgi:hypothetical protein